MKKYSGIVLLAILLIMQACGARRIPQAFDEAVDVCYRTLGTGSAQDIEKALSAVYDMYMAENDPLDSLARELRELRKQDQGIRLLYLDAKQRFSGDSIRQAKVRETMNCIDRANEKKAVDIIEKYGWLTKDDVGVEAAEALFLIVQHCADTELQTRCLPRLKAAVEEEASVTWQYAFLVDRTVMNQGKSQTYGTQKIIVEGMSYPVPINDVDMVDARRAEMGLGSIWEELNDEYDSDWSLANCKDNIGKIEEVYRNYLNNRMK